MKIVLDTNIIVSGLISKLSPPAQLLQAWSDAHFTLVTSRLQITELFRVLDYDRIRPLINIEQKKRLQKNLDTEAMICDIHSNIDLSSDPDDNVILATAVSGGADLIVSGDKQHLIALNEVEGIPIVTAHAALQYLKRLELR